MSKIAENVYSFNWVCKLCFLKIFGLNMTKIVFTRNNVNMILSNIASFSFDLISNKSIGTIYGAIFIYKTKHSWSSTMFHHVFALCDLIFNIIKREEIVLLFSLFSSMHHPLKELRGRHVVSIQFFVLEWGI